MNKNNNFNNNNNFNINNINFNNLKKHLPKENHTYFFIVIGVILIILIALIIRNFLYASSLYAKYVKNVFFREMDNLNGKPASADNMKSICIQGKRNNKSKNEILNKYLHIKHDYLLMFWVKLDSEKIAKYINDNDSSKIKNTPILKYSDSNNSNFYPKFEMDIMNNEMSVYVGTDTNVVSKLYNLPYDEWFCITSLVKKDHMDIYINGKLVKIIEYTSNKLKPNKNNKMTIGPYPGYIAYLQVNNDDSYFNPENIYEEYLLYKSLIKLYVDNQYHKQYKIRKMQDANHHDGSYNRPPKKKNEKENKCRN
jgi:hypothetical protein